MDYCKGTKSPPLLVLHSFYNQKVSMDLERTQATSISRQAITSRKGSSKIGGLWGLPPPSLVDMLHSASGGFSI